MDQVNRALTTFGQTTNDAMELLRARGRSSRRWLKRALEVEDDVLDDICFELIEVLRVVVEDGGILRWTGPATNAQLAPEKVDEAEQRRLTFLFCDLVGSTSFSSTLDADDLRDVIVEYLNSAGAVVEQMGGTMARYLGDGLLAYFGWPKAHDDDAIHAVKAGLLIVERVAELAKAPGRLPYNKMDVRVGLHTGSAVIGDIGAGVAREALATGQTPNVGARIESVAEPSTVCMSEATALLVQGRFELEDRGLFAVKGVQAPLRVFRALRERSPSPAGHAMMHGVVPLVGRIDVTTRLDDAWRRCEAGECAALALCGEPGIGKSRLVHYLKSTSAPGALLLEGHCHRMAVHTSLQPITEALRGWWGNTGSAMRAIELAVSACPRLDPMHAVPLLATALQIPLAAERLRPMEDWSASQRRAVMFEVMAAVIVAQAANQPVVFVLEDAHWADPSTLEWIEILRRRAEGCAVMLLLTHRPELHELPQGFDVIELAPLSSDEVGQLVASIAGSVNLPDRQIERLIQRAGGNPLFVEELAKALLREQTRGKGNDENIMAERSQADIPATLYAPLMARLDRMGPARRLIQIAATIGHRFDVGLLQAVAEVDDAILRRQLASLAEEQLLHCRDTSTWEFHHALIQDVAVSTLLRRTRRQINARIARTLIDQGFGTPVPPERIAYHLTEAGEIQDAVGWWHEAGTQSLRRSANAEAAAHFSRALELFSSLPAEPGHRAIELELRTKYAVPLTHLRGWAAQEVTAQYQRAQELCGEIGDAPELLPTRVGLQTFLIVSGKPREAQRMAYDTLALAQRLGDPACIMEAEHDCGTTSIYLGEFERGVAHLERVEELYVPERDHAHVYQYGKDPLAVARVHRVIAQACCGRIDNALVLAHRNVSHTEAWPHPFSRLWALLGVAVVHTVRQEYAAAGEVGSRVAAEARELGYPTWEAQAMTYQGLGLAAAGRHAEGIALIETGLAMWRKTGAQVGLPGMLSHLLRALLMARRTEEAWNVAQQTLAQIERSAEAWTYPNTLRLCGEAAVLREGDEAAEPWFRKALRRAHAMSASTWALGAGTSLAALLRRRGEPEKARAVLEPLLRRWHEGRDTPLVVAACHACKDGTKVT